MFEKSFFQSLIICVIAVDDHPRSGTLVKSITENFPTSQILMVNAITPDKLSQDYLADLKEQSANLLGRNVGSKEIAVLLSHRKCYEIFLNSSKKYLLVLEDDVVLNSNVFDLLSITKRLNMRKPCVVSLYSPSWSIWKKNRNGIRAKFPPACAAAYFMNVHAAHLAVSNNPIGIADWPPWAQSVDFYLENFLDVHLLQEQSFLEDQRILDKGIRFRKVLFKPTPAGIKKIWQIRYILIYPFYWKFHKTIRKYLFRSNSNSRFITRA